MLRKELFGFKILFIGVCLQLSLCNAASILSSDISGPYGLPDGVVIREAPQDFLFDNTEFISKLIETSYTISEECYSEIIESLDYLKYSGGKSGILSEPFPIDVKMRDLGEEYAGKYQKGSPTERFYYSSSKDARKSIEDQMKWAEEVLDEQ